MLVAIWIAVPGRSMIRPAVSPSLLKHSKISNHQHLGSYASYKKAYFLWFLLWGPSSLIFIAVDRALSSPSAPPNTIASSSCPGSMVHLVLPRIDGMPVPVQDDGVQRSDADGEYEDHGHGVPKVKPVHRIDVSLDDLSLIVHVRIVALSPVVGDEEHSVVAIVLALHCAVSVQDDLLVAPEGSEDLDSGAGHHEVGSEQK